MATVAGLEIESLCADLTTFVPGRRLDDDGNLLMRYTNGARGPARRARARRGDGSRRVGPLRPLPRPGPTPRLRGLRLV